MPFDKSHTTHLHPSRSVKYRQWFSILSPDSRDFEYCNDPSSRQSQKIMRQRAEYERRRSELHANPSSPVKPPRPPASSSHDSAATPAHDQVFHDADPVFFNSPETKRLTTTIILAYDLNKPPSRRIMGSSGEAVARDIVTVILYVLKQTMENENDTTTSPLPPIIADETSIEHDTFTVFSSLWVVMEGIVCGSGAVFREAVEDVLRKTNPDCLTNAVISTDPTLLGVNGLFLRVFPFKNFVLPLWDLLFAKWYEAGCFGDDSADNNFGDDLRRRSSSAAVYYSESDPLGGVVEPFQGTEDGKTGGGGDAPKIKRSLNKTLLPHVAAALLLQLYEDATSPEIEQSHQLVLQPSRVSNLFGSPHELFFAATVLQDPLYSQEQSSCPLNLALLSSYLERDYSVLQNGNNVVIFLDGPLGMLLNHKPSIGLMVNSFQGQDGQAESSKCVQIGDVIVAVNGHKISRDKDAHALVTLIKKLSRPVMITFIHAGITPEALALIEAKEKEQSRVCKCLADDYELDLLPGEFLLDCAQSQMKASVFGIAEAAGGMCGVGCLANESSPLQHPLTSLRKIESNPVSSAWMPGVAMVSGALFVTNFRVVFHRAKTSGLIVDRSVVEERNRKNRLQRSYSRSPVRNTSTSSATTKERTSTGNNSSSISSSPKMMRGRSSLSTLNENIDVGEILEDEEANDDWEVPLGTILKVECFGENEFGAVKVNVPTLGVLTKDGRAVKFVMPFSLGNTHELCIGFGKKLEQVCFKDVVAPGAAWGGEWGGEVNSGGNHYPGTPTNNYGVRGKRGSKMGEFASNGISTGNGGNSNGDNKDTNNNAVQKGIFDPDVKFAIQYYQSLSQLDPERARYIKEGAAKVFGTYTLMGEYERLGLLNDSGLRIVRSSSDLHPNNPTSYPEELVQPAGMTNDELKRVCSFRSKSRIPAIVYVHPVTRALMSRSAQPLVGLGKNRCSEDEKLLGRIMNLTSTTRFYIMDARKKAAATGNKFMGKGTEDVKNYSCASMLHMDIENIHSVRESEMQVWDITRPSSSVGCSNSWYGLLEKSGWMQHVHAVLSASARCACILSQEGSSVLVHCSDGWDRTSQIVSLSQIILDPYFRTFKGFRTIVEKEWLDFGHKFNDRTGRGVSARMQGNEERSSIFTLWIDCISQVMKQFPTDFEYNESFLVAILDQLYAGRSGSFYGNTCRERSNWQGECFTVWEILYEMGVDRFTNRSYADKKRMGGGVRPPDELNVNCNPKNLTFFSGYFSRFDSSLLNYSRPKTFF